MVSGGVNLMPPFGTPIGDYYFPVRYWLQLDLVTIIAAYLVCWYTRHHQRRLELMMKPFSDIDLPPEFKFDSVEKNDIGETNDVFRCVGEWDDRPVTAYVKVSKHRQLSLVNEWRVLRALAHTGLPVPVVLWYGGEQNDVLITGAAPGYMIWDYIDPRRRLYDEEEALRRLHAYGECLARVHNLDVTWSPQTRTRLCGFIGEERVDDERFRRLVSWVESNSDISPGQVFVHGDFNTASVLFDGDAVSGIVDWEFAGQGWREYDIAWALRARLYFLNTTSERDAILDGYRQHASFDEDALRWCEVLNYLHFAYWCRNHEPAYTAFALEQARVLAGVE